jgi:hypothetical protein
MTLSATDWKVLDSGHKVKKTLGKPTLDCSLDPR